MMFAKPHHHTGMKQRISRFISALLIAVFSLTFVASDRSAFAGSKKRNILLGVGIGIGLGVAIAKGKKKLRRKNRNTRKTRKSKRKVVRKQRSTTKRVASKRKKKSISNTNRAAARKNGVRVQTALAALGLYTMNIDGAIGPGSRRSISAFQQQNGYAPTGRLDKEQRALLFAMADGRQPSATARGGTLAGTETSIFGEDKSRRANNDGGSSDIFGAPPAPVRTQQNRQTATLPNDGFQAKPAKGPADGELESIFDAPSESKVAGSSEFQPAPQTKPAGSSLFDE